MAARPGYGQPDPRNPFANPSQQYSRPGGDYDAESDASDHYGARTDSTAHLAGSEQYYDQPGQFDPYGMSAIACVTSAPMSDSLLFWVPHMTPDDMPMSSSLWTCGGLE